MRHSYLKTALLALICFSAPSFAIVGVGIHWGFDYSMSMNNEAKEPVTLHDGLNPDLMYISRMGFERTPINFGGKIVVDILPIDIEVSTNMGVWQYNGSLSYSTDPLNNAAPYDTIDLHLEDLSGIRFFGVDETPYAKFNLDLSLRKSFKFPIIQPSVGLGATFNFATPVLSNSFIQKALGLDKNVNFEDIVAELDNPAVQKKILDELTDGFSKPRPGMHFLAGLQIKLPVIPLAFYVDGKFMLMFNDIEEETGLRSKGFLLNTGIMFKI